MTKKKDPADLKKPGRKPKDAAPSPAPKTSAPADPLKTSNVSPSPNPLKDLAARVLEERKGDPAQARDVKDKKGQEKKPAQNAPKKTVEPPDPEMVKACANVFAESESQLAALVVPAAQAEGVQKKTYSILKFGWEFYFTREGLDAVPSWAVLLIAHFAAGAVTLVPTKDSIAAWFGGFKKKVISEKPAQGNPDHKPQFRLAAEPAPPVSELPPPTGEVGGVGVGA